MTNSHSPQAAATSTAPPTVATGLGWWNLYFLIKLGLYAKGAIDFHLLENIAFIAALLIPLQGRWLSILRQAIAIPAALWLLHFDSYLPPLGRLTAQLDQIMSFEWFYLAELLQRFIPADAVFGLILLTVVFYFVNQILRVTTIVIFAIAAISLQQWFFVAGSQGTTTTTRAPSLASNRGPSGDINTQLNRYVTDFFSSERQRTVSFPDTIGKENQFDILLISVCSLSWDDLDAVGYRNHPFFKRFDVVFEQFNSATTYSGPALLRLTRANCGQPTHGDLYQPAPAACKTFELLEARGYQEALIMNHDGEFNDLLERTRRFGGIEAELISQQGIEVTQKAFAGSPVVRDGPLLERWWDQRQQLGEDPVIALYNTATLHDGNRLVGKNVTGSEGYKLRLDALLTDLEGVFDRLERSKRNIMVILIPEHGAGLEGDHMQISGMREIPSPAITHVPVAAKLFGPDMKRIDEPAFVSGPSGHMALSALIDAVIRNDVFANQRFSAGSLVSGLPETASVSQNEGSTVVEYRDEHYLSLDGTTWSRYASP